MGAVDPLIVDCWAGDEQLGRRPAGHGLVVSSPDWAKLIAAGPPWHGAIIKASEGLPGPDAVTQSHLAWFREEWPKLRELAGDRYGVDWFRGAYHYARVAEDPIKQAHVFLGQVEQAGGWGAGDLWPMVDVESSNNPLVSTKGQLESWITRYADEIFAATGRRPTLYGNIYLWQSGVTSHCGCETLIVARYTPTLPPVTYQRIGWTWGGDPDVKPPTLLGWQYCGDGSAFVPAYPTKSPIGDIDITALVVANGGPAALAWLQRQLGCEPAPPPSADDVRSPDAADLPQARVIKS